MGEPEDVIMDAAHVATEQVVELWRSRADGHESASVALDEVKQRLSLFLKAVFDLSAPIVPAQPPRVPNVVVRWFKGIPAHNIRRQPIAATDGYRIKLPPRLAVRTSREAARARYRLLAVQQAERIRRGTVARLPDPPLVRRLYLLAEACAVDRHIADELPGLADAHRSERRRALAGRPDREGMSAAEKTVEAWLVALLESDPADAAAPAPFRHCPTPTDALAWARATAERVPEGPFRGLPSPQVWGEVEAEGSPVGRAGDAQNGPAPSDEEPSTERSRKVERRPRVRDADEEEDDSEGMFMIPRDDLHETAQDPMGLSRPTDKDDEADAENLAESLAEMEEAKLVQSDQRSREVLESDDPPPREVARMGPAREQSDGFRYPEWDYRESAYKPGEVVVRERDAAEGSQRWVEETLDAKHGLLRRVRRSFEQLRPRRRRLRRQPDGPEVDIGAFVEAYGDRRAGCAPEHRLYQTVEPRRRDVAIDLLIDVSASTDSWLHSQRRVVDVEKEALLVVCEALETLGDPYAVDAFSGRGPGSVSVWPVKEFDGPYDAAVRRRIAGLEPDRYTRTGAALRHATTRLADRKASHRLLLFLSDGKPNDLDDYEGRYGIEDTRQAVAEAEMQGIDVFCLTIDREAPEYMDRIFGPEAYAVLRHPELLPKVLVKVVSRLLER